MKFTISAALLSLTSLVASINVPRQNCPEATRFGVLSVTQTGPNPGDNLNINVDFTCGIQSFGIIPMFLDYTIEVPTASNNGHEPPIVLARRTFPSGALSDSFTVPIPHTFYFAGAPYNLVFTNTYPISGTDGSQVLIQGGLSQGISINGTQ